MSQTILYRVDMPLSKETNIWAGYNGPSEILCSEHDYKKFPGLDGDLAEYAKKWKGGGWDDIKVNVQYALGTKIVISEPIVKPQSLPVDTTVVLAEDTVRNYSDETIETSIQLRGTHTNSMSATVESEFSTELGVEIGAEIDIFSSSMSTKVSTTSRKGQTQTSSQELQYTRVVNLKVPPNKGYRVKMTATVQTREVSVTLPSKIQGLFRIQYPNRRDGHYYWMSYISCAASHNNDQSNFNITVEDGIAIHVDTVIEDLAECVVF